MATQNPNEAVVTYHPIASKIGSDILHQGGNAFDAFVAATAAEYVLGEGVTSLGGPLGALLYDAKTKSAVFLDAGFNQPLNPLQKWDPQSPQAGAAVLVPGAVAGLEAISMKYGRLPFKKVLEPAIKLAETGFPLNKLYAALIANAEYGKVLKQSRYGSRTYFKNGKPLAEGDLLKLPEVAQFLKNISQHGSKYVYKGKWAKECLSAVNAQGGHLRQKDFLSYKANWQSPWKISYRNVDIYSPRTKGGLNTLLSLKVLEHADLRKYQEHFSSSTDALEIMTRVQDEVSDVPELNEYAKLNDDKFLASVFSQSQLDGIWDKVQKKRLTPVSGGSGTHSYHIVVIDSEGNAVTGTNTIESFPWGKGIFVEGIPLTAAGTLPFGTKPGMRIQNPLSMQVGIRNNSLLFASGAFSASLIPASFEFVVNIVDYGLSASEAVNRPRFGDQAWDIYTMKPLGGHWLDSRIDQNIVDALAKKGMKFIQKGYIDTGLGAVAIVNEDGKVDGAIAPLSSVGFTPGFNH